MERAELAVAKTMKERRHGHLRLAQATMEMLERQQVERIAALAEALHPGGAGEAMTVDEALQEIIERDR